MKAEGKRRIWKDYQKEIANDKYFYARSCIRQNFFPGSEKVFTQILKDELGKDLHDNQHHTSCTGIGYHTDVVPFETTMTVVARQFALMTEAGYENYIASCITSFRWRNTGSDSLCHCGIGNCAKRCQPWRRRQSRDCIGRKRRTAGFAGAHHRSRKWNCIS